MYRSSTETPGAKTNSSSTLINRTAVDSSGGIGVLYDGYRDQVLDSLNLIYKENSCSLHQIRQCEIVSGKKGNNPDIFQMVNIDDESRLSLLLSLNEKKGLATINDYCNPVNEYTRVFCYTYVERVQNLLDIPKDIQKIGTRLRSNIPATHMITKVEWGIDIAVVLQLLSLPDSVTEIDRVLQRICTFLQSDGETLPLQLDEKNILKKIVHTRVFSNTNEISRLTTLYDVCTYIQQNRKNTAKHPVSYGLQSITQLYPQYYDQGPTFVALTAELNRRIQQYALHVTSNTKKSKAFIADYLSKRLSQHLPKELLNVQKQRLHVEKKCMEEVERFGKLVLAVRNGQIKMTRIDDALKDETQITITKTIAEFSQVLNDLAEKEHFISDLERLHFRYVDAAGYDLDSADNERTIENRLVTNAEDDRILCSNDLLNKSDPAQLRHLRDDLVEQFENNPKLRLIYADFTYCSHQLQYMMRLPMSIYNTENNRVKQEHSTILPTKTQTPVPASAKVPIDAVPVTKTERYGSLPVESKTTIPPVKEDQRSAPSRKEPQRSTAPLSSTKVQNTDATVTKTQTNVSLAKEPQIASSKSAKLQTSSPSFTEKPTPAPTPTKVQTADSLSIRAQTKPQASSSSTASVENDVINILLLGETGVGKSTFINAFANYLTFDTLQQAEKNQAVVLIPVSFLLTVGDNFDEYIVKFGNVGDVKNEDFAHPGQSVTQHCRSYTFNLSGDNRKKLCIIDTPGFGDTRGLDQDDYNMAHILDYIRKLSHLNAVCFLLKPNESRLNIFFRSCLTQLFTLLGPNIAENILFCFTNSRSTFYTPGNTAPLLKKMLTSLSKVDVPFRKDNTFCFDSESFRYLVSLQNGIPFSDLERKEYEMSWVKSVAEAQRLVRYLRATLRAYHIPK